MRAVVADCITPDPDKRPDVTQVLAVATAMHSKTQLPSSAMSSLSYSPGNSSSLHSSHSTMADSFKNIRLSP